MRPGVLVFGKTEQSQVPPEGALIERVVWRNSDAVVYVCSLKGESIGIRAPDELEVKV